MKFHTVSTITNGVLLTEANIGQWVEWTSVLTNLETGDHHRTVQCGGYYSGNRVDNTTGWLYAMFRNGKIGNVFQNELGSPVAFFHNNNN